MKNAIFAKVQDYPFWKKLLGLGFAVSGLIWINGILDASYAASKFPVSFFVGQTGFNAELIKEYYNYMLTQHTLDTYWKTQFIDFGFIGATMLVGLFAGLVVAHLARSGSWGKKFAIFAGAAVVTGAVCDIIENLWSFVMLSDPMGFADWIVLPYSAFASVKFALIALGMVSIFLALLLIIVGRIVSRPAIG